MSRPLTKVAATLALLAQRRGLGVTWQELAQVEKFGHGSASRVLSDLHKTGDVARLKETRYRCKVYVLPEHVNGRDTEPQGRPVTLAEQALAGMIEDQGSCADKVVAVVKAYRLQESRHPAMWALAADLLAAVDRAGDNTGGVLL